MTRHRTRRSVLALAGSSLALAGCLGDDSDDTGNGGEGDDWQSATLEDVTTGESFAIGELDQPVVLHTFATWCSTCRSQQSELKRVHGRRDDVAFVDMTIDENDDPDDLRTHAEENGLDWRFAVSPGGVTSDLVDEFGQSVAVAPQSPVIVVCPDGSTHTVDKGSSADTIESALDENCA